MKAEAVEAGFSPELVNRFFDVLTVQKTAQVLLTDGIATVLQMLKLPDGTVKVLDFGLAKAFESADPSSASAMKRPPRGKSAVPCLFAWASRI